MYLIATLLQNQPPAPIALTHTPIPTTSTATELQALLREIGKYKPYPTLTVPTFTHNKRKNWCSIVKSKLKLCPRYRVLHDNVPGTLTEALVTFHPEEDSSLSDRFLKVMDTSTKALFTVEEQISGYHIFKSSEDSASTQKSDAEIDLMYIQWMYIKRTTTKSIRDFAARVQTEVTQFDGTDYEVKSKSLARRWRKGLGSDFQSQKKWSMKQVLSQTDGARIFHSAN